MVYKKYIKKNGRIYGPYLYNSKRVGDKVVSEYVGDSSLSKKRKLYIIFTAMALVFVALVFLFFILRSPNSSGNVVSDVKNSFKQTGAVSSGDSTPTGDSSTNLSLDSSNMVGNELFQQSARVYKDWIIVTFKYGNYQIEHSYNKGLSQSELDSLVAKDKTDWLNSLLVQ